MCYFSKPNKQILKKKVLSLWGANTFLKETLTWEACYSSLAQSFSSCTESFLSTMGNEITSVLISPLIVLPKESPDRALMEVIL